MKNRRVHERGSKQLNANLSVNTKPASPSALSNKAPEERVATVQDPLGLRTFHEFGSFTRQGVCRCHTHRGEAFEVPVFVNEFWTSKQRAAHSLHEISYRACFKPQLPRFFIERLMVAGDVVYDPCMGRGTTVLEAALLGRVPWGNDISPLSIAMVKPRLNPPATEAVAKCLTTVFSDQPGQDWPQELLVFYHPETLRQICSLRCYLARRRASGAVDAVDEWIELVALNRLTGHSPGFFSVYTMPPNQAVTVEKQRQFNQQRHQTPQPRDLPGLILKKTCALLRDCDLATREHLAQVAPRSILLTKLASRTEEIPHDSVSLVVTSPPFLDVVDYATDNWLRCWFLGIDPESVELTVPSRLTDWQASMGAVFRELYRVSKPGGYIAFEVGEVRNGSVKLEEAVIPCGAAAGLQPVLVVINRQNFTKTAHCWGVNNNTKGTNTNRVVLFRKCSR